MKMLVCACPLLLIIFCSTSPAGAGEQTLAGHWLGTLTVGGTSLRIVFNLSAAEDGTWTATMDSPDQGAMGLPVGDVTVAGATLTIDVPVVMGKYTGTADLPAGKIAGEWAQGGGKWPLDLSRGSAPVALSRPQEPKAPLPYASQDVAFPNDHDHIMLAGTLTTPPGDGPFPAVALISGSGPEDRNEQVFGHKPFLILADHLTRHGIAVLRYDDRGVGQSTGVYAEATTVDLARDAAAAVAFLKTRREIDPRRIGLAGHSEGALIAPLASDNAGAGAVAFLILLACPGVTGEEILYEQGRLIGLASGATPEDVAKNQETQKKIFAVLKSESDNQTARQRIVDIITESVKDTSGEQQPEQQGLAEMITAQAEQTVSPWFRFFLTYDPIPVLARQKMPVLALFGSKDLQVPPGQNFLPVKHALVAAGNPLSRASELPGLNHLFQTADSGAPSEYSVIEETFSPVALSAISDWLANVSAVPETESGS